MEIWAFVIHGDLRVKYVIPHLPELQHLYEVTANITPVVDGRQYSLLLADHVHGRASTMYHE